MERAEGKQWQRGFSIIELVMVIALLGILSVVALPRFLDLREDTRSAMFDSLSGSLITAANMAHVKQTISGLGPNDPIMVDGKIISMVNGYPTDNAIGLLVNFSGFDYMSGAGWFLWSETPRTDCRIDYNYAGWPHNPDLSEPYLVRVETGC
ncbi:type II secretion system protein [Neptuniibacter halophilus]|uniref:type II secretion system protein n=1 Tax=Neptuniibacter halophilus TaxID=651666 RepID=UPI002572AEEA|nr:prepilin-type N-terminal cleavage/methylation domain-containing protein [Neptuniibacter halophilus]